ncbi:FadR/GntR family transcriptional regulator [Arthrobacter sp.]|uniref:FadR/GntR family transcriptional regulator n=1 Tax=Arthrobacter sp. TaxID=1667 RepID=UPI003A92BFA8
MSPNLTSTLVEHLRREIIEGRIAAGDKLPSESALIAAHAVSRTVVREAITRLQAEGLVHTRRGSGSFALTPPPDPPGGTGPRPARSLPERRALLDFRMGVESEAAALAAGARKPRDLEVLRSALLAFSAAGTSPSEALSCDFAFHQGVARASGNPYFSDVLDGLGPAMISMPRHRLAPGTADAHRLGDVMAEHNAVFAAIEDQDPRAAAAAMRTHLVNSRRRLEAGSGA